MLSFKWRQQILIFYFSTHYRFNPWSLSTTNRSCPVCGSANPLNESQIGVSDSRWVSRVSNGRTHTCKLPFWSVDILGWITGEHQIENVQFARNVSQRLNTTATLQICRAISLSLWTTVRVDNKNNGHRRTHFQCCHKYLFPRIMSNVLKAMSARRYKRTHNSEMRPALEEKGLCCVIRESHLLLFLIDRLDTALAVSSPPFTDSLFT